VTITPLALDTPPEIERMQVAGWRQMSPEQRAATVTALTTFAIRLAEAGIRHRHPHESDTARRKRLAVILLGTDLANRAFPDTIRTP
jgi:hypothetical protein